ncbi:MAG: CPBP family intramembrane glutamic endopeptidase [Methanomicrobiaceae archaeon]|nr:CPBP family intramembrane glutamic endopeptidase [Methanomicrobiaceae archaeon]
MNTGVKTGNSRILLIACITYLLWVGATYLLEGRILTLLRPEAVMDRIVYTIAANIIIGSILALWVIRKAIDAGTITLESSGFRPGKRAVIAVAIAIILGSVVMLISRPASLDPVVLLNVSAQVFPVTIAEIAVCWAVIGSVLEGVLKPRGGWLATIAAIIVASLLFGVYHLGHSPPFNQPGMIGFLTLVGLVTGLVYFLFRDIYATMFFHNFFGSIGVMQSLADAGTLPQYTTPLYPVLGLAAFSLLVFIAVEGFFVRRGAI